MSKYASEGKDWVQDMMMHLPKKDEVNIALITMRQPTKLLLEKRRRCTKHKTVGELDLTVLEAPREWRGDRWKSGVTARRWWTGSLGRQGKGRRGHRLECPTIVAGNGVPRAPS